MKWCGRSSRGPEMWLQKICGKLWEDCAGFGALSLWTPNARRAEKKIVLPGFAN